MSAATSPERPWPLRTVARKIAEYVDRLGAVWVEGQLTQVNARPGAGTAFLVLRDPAAEVSLTLTCAAALSRDLLEGSRVVVHGKPSFFVGRGTLSLRVDEIRAVGVGELLARVERLRRSLAADGLFDPARKRPLPFLPHTVGLITGRASAAEHDVLSNARARWPAVRFRVLTTAVQGALAVPQMLEALTSLDADPDVEVIVLARGGGSVEDLLPFSDETLCRAVAGCATPVVSAIGHEPDSPLVDHVADLRCSTPTDAGKRVVPDVAEESARVAALRGRCRRALAGWVDRECRLLDGLRSRPVLADPVAPLAARMAAVDALRQRGRRCVSSRVRVEAAELGHLRAQLRTLGPAATLARGYAVVQRVQQIGGDAGGNAAPRVLRSVTEAPPGTRVGIRLVDGILPARVTGGTTAVGPSRP